MRIWNRRGVSVLRWHRVAPANQLSGTIRRGLNMKCVIVLSEAGWADRVYYRYVFYGPRTIPSWCEWMVPGTYIEHQSLVEYNLCAMHKE